MKFIKITLAEVISALAILVFGFISFLGTNFLYIESEKVWGFDRVIGCILIAITISIILGILSFFLVSLKKTSRKFKSRFLLELLVLILFIFFTILFSSKSSPFIHYFSVSSKSEEITSQLDSRVDTLIRMFTKYESYVAQRESDYKQHLQSISLNKASDPITYGSCGFNATSSADNNKIDIKVGILKRYLFPSNYTDTSGLGIRDIAYNWLADAKVITSQNKWKPIGVVDIIRNIDINAANWNTQLTTISRYKAPCEQASVTPFPILMPFHSIKSEFTTVMPPSPVALTLVVFCYVLILLPWFIARRNSRFPGFRHLFRMSKSENEL